MVEDSKERKREGRKKGMSWVTKKEKKRELVYVETIVLDYERALLQP